MEEVDCHPERVFGCFFFGSLRRGRDGRAPLRAVTAADTMRAQTFGDSSPVERSSADREACGKSWTGECAAIWGIRSKTSRGGASVCLQARLFRCRLSSSEATFPPKPNTD